MHNNTSKLQVLCGNYKNALPLSNDNDPKAFYICTDILSYFPSFVNMFWNFFVFISLRCKEI